MLADVSNEQHLILRANLTKEISHLLGRYQRGFIDHIKMLCCWVCGLAAGKKALQGVGIDACVAELSSCTRGRGEALDRVAIPFRSFAHSGQTGGFPNAR